MRTLVFLIFASTAIAQTGAITGRIADEFDVPVAGASVQAKDAANKEYRTVSGVAGEYIIDKLTPGIFEVSVTAQTMKNFVKKGFEVTGAPTRLDVKLFSASSGTLGEDDRFISALYRGLGTAPPAGPAPIAADGKPDLSGFWMLPFGPGRPPTQQAGEPLPWAEAIQRERVASSMRDIPSSRCLPLSIVFRNRVKFVYTSSVLLMLYSENPPRQIFLDGRNHPKELNPTWQGHSVGHWKATPWSSIRWVSTGWHGARTRFHRPKCCMS